MPQSPDDTHDLELKPLDQTSSGTRSGPRKQADLTTAVEAPSPQQLAAESIDNHPDKDFPTSEHRRLQASAERTENWQRWGPYLAERQWGTVREDYSENGDCWSYFPHDHARSRAYRWGEDGLLGITDRQCRLCFGLALWNGKDAILKERLYGLSGHQGNHGEDVKEVYHYLASSPTHSYLKALYRYPQRAFPYRWLEDENRLRGLSSHEFELEDTNLFDNGRYFDVQAEYAKKAPNDIAIRLTITNQGPEHAELHLLPTLWFRNTWSWGCEHEGCWLKPSMSLKDPTTVDCRHESLGAFSWYVGEGPDGDLPELIFTENETNQKRLWGQENPQPYVKDAFHRYIIQFDRHAVNPKHRGTKCAAVYKLKLQPNQRIRIRLRLCENLPEGLSPWLGVDALLAQRHREMDAYYRHTLQDDQLPEEERRIAHQAIAGLMWTKQFYHYSVRDWLDGDPETPAPPTTRRHGRNSDWPHLFNRDIISMPDCWEYPWYAAWDLAFHCVSFAMIDPDFAKDQLTLMLREWYMHPNGQIPAYEFAFSDVNPPVHAWACLRVYQMTRIGTERGDIDWLARCFHKLMINFTWWVNRKDAHGNHLFSGGFLGLDNIGIFDRSKDLPGGGTLEQADGTAWMAFYCGNMLTIALELAQHDAVYEDVASKFFEHYIAIVDAINEIGGSGLWHEEDGFYYDKYMLDDQVYPLQVKSVVGLIPLFAAQIMCQRDLIKLPGFLKRMDWFLENRKDLAQHISWCQGGIEPCNGSVRYLLALPNQDKLRRVLKRILDPNSFLSPYGIRSLSKEHEGNPFSLTIRTQTFSVQYTPSTSNTWLFGGNSNWRGPVWFPINFLFIETLETYHQFYGDDFKIECPTGSGQMMTLAEVARDICQRLVNLFLPDENGIRPALQHCHLYRQGEPWQDELLFHEFFHGDQGEGLGASHQTGWTALVLNCLDKLRTSPV